MTALIVLAAVLGLICLSLAVRLIQMKAAMKDISSELEESRQRSYDRQVRIPLIDRELEGMASEINRNLYFQKLRKLEAEHSEKLMRQSVSDIAHDLRTPLTVIKGNLQLLETEEGISPEGRRHLEICMGRSELLRQMIDDFFELSVLESDDTQAALKRTDITALFLQFIADSEAVIRQAGLEPQIGFPEKSVFIMADEQLLMRMMGNLLNNVVKYAKGSFSAELTERDGKCVIAFSNEVYGDNIPDPHMMFERSYRADRARKSGSAGLGLYIVRLLADRQGAEVRARLSDSRLYLEMEFAAE